MAFKRKRVMAPRSGGMMKRRRFMRKRRMFRRGSRSNAVTSKSGVGNRFGFRSRRLRPRQWRRVLWRDTLSQTHYRSNSSNNFVLTAAGTAFQYQIGQAAALRISGNQFFTAGGGLILPDPPAATAFIGNITVRGGIIGIRIANMNATVTAQEVKVYLIKTSRNFVVANIPANRFLGWDPTIEPDFQLNVGRIVMAREAILENGSSVDFKFRLRPFKIDRDEYDNDKNSFLWVIMWNDNEGAASAVSVAPYYNISFAADAIGTA